MIARLQLLPVFQPLTREENRKPRVSREELLRLVRHELERDLQEAERVPATPPLDGDPWGSGMVH